MALSAKEAAEKALEIAWDGNLPVRPTAIANSLVMFNGNKKFKIDMIGKSLKDEYGQSFSGQAYFDENDEVYRCEYNQDENELRIRFTMAHELGHVLLGHVSDGEKKKRDTENTAMDIYEIDANKFAAELLMPEVRVKHFVLSFASISSMAHAFRVSETAMLYRLKNLGIKY